MRWMLVTILTGAIAVATSLTAQAGVIDPQLFVGPLGSNSPANGTAIGGETNLITGNSTSTSFSVGVAGGGNTIMQSPLLVVFALNTGSSVALSGPGCPSTGCVLATPGIYGLGTNSTSLNPGDNLYQVLSLNAGSGGGASDTYANISAAALLNFCPSGQTLTHCTVPSSYAVEVFEVPASLTGHQGISLTETGATAGSFIGLYGCTTKATPAGGGCTDGDIGATPLTNAGLITDTSNVGPPPPPPPPPPPVPEPSSLALLGVGLVGLFAGLRRRR
jgi:hypothetical protein